MPTAIGSWRGEGGEGEGEGGVWAVIKSNSLTPLTWQVGKNTVERVS